MSIRDKLVLLLAEKGINIGNEVPLAQIQAIARTMGIDVDKVKNGPVPKKAQVKKRRRTLVKDIGKPKDPNLTGDNPDDILQPGTYAISFIGHFVGKDESFEKALFQEITIKEPKKKEDIVADIAAEFIDEHIHASDVSFLKFTDWKELANGEAFQFIDEILAKGARLQYKMLPEDIIINKNPGECALDFIMYELNASGNFTTYTRPKLIDELQTAGCIDPLSGVSVQNIINYALAKKYISVFALNPFGYLINKHVADKVKATLVFKLNNEHIFPIVQNELKKAVAQTKRLDLKEIKFDIQDYSDATYVNVENFSSLELPSTKLILVDTNDLSAFVSNVIETTGYIPVNNVARGALVECFQHPVTQSIIIAAPKYKERKAVLEREFAERRSGDGTSPSSKLMDFMWSNQSWSKIGKDMMRHEVGILKESTYSPDYMQVLDNYGLHPYIVDLTLTSESRAFLVGSDGSNRNTSLDIKRDYPSILIKNRVDFNVFHHMDEIRPCNFSKIGDLRPGEYYIRNDFYMADGTIFVSKGFWPLVLVLYALKHHYIALSDLTYCILASQVLKHDCFKKFCLDTIAKYPTASKALLNHWIGDFGKQYNKTSKAEVTDSWKIAYAMYKQDPSIELHPFGNIWFMRKTTKERVLSGHVPIHRHIIAASYIELDQMYKKVRSRSPDLVVLGYNTDSIKVRNLGDFVAVEKEFAKPGDIVQEENCFIKGHAIDELKRNPEYCHEFGGWDRMGVEEFAETEGGASALVSGMPGSGKTQKLLEQYNEDLEDKKKSIALCFTNTAMLNLQDRGVKNVYTFHGFFNAGSADNPVKMTMSQQIEKCAQIDVIQVDEFTTVPHEWYHTLWNLKYKYPKMQFRLYGDSDQCKAHTKKGELWYSYHNSRLVKVLCNYRLVELPYLEETARYKKDLKIELDYFKQHKKLSSNWINDAEHDSASQDHFESDECDFNIVPAYKRDQVNEKWHAYYSQGKELVEVGSMKIFIGMPCIAKQNSKKEGVINSTKYVVMEINGNDIHLSHSGKSTAPAVHGSATSIRITKAVFAKTMRYGYADTIMRCQGATLRKKYNIWVGPKMSWNEMYTALSRATKKDDVRVQYTKREFVRETPPRGGQAIEPKPVEISTGYIYRFKNATGEYIGSTECVEKREAEHYANPVSEKMAKWLKETKPKMEVLHEFQYTNKKQLVNFEYSLIARIPSELCMNTNGAKKKIEPKVDGIEIEYNRFRILDDEKGERYRIKLPDGTIKPFRYKQCGKEAALAKAEEFRRQLVRENYL